LNLPIGSQKLRTGLACITVILQKKLKKVKEQVEELIGSFWSVLSRKLPVL
jgi:hypothetical protein